MPDNREIVRDKMERNAWQPSRHSFLLTPEQAAAYEAAGGGAAGRRAVLAMMDGGTPDFVLLERYWKARYRFEASHGLPDIDHDPGAVDGSPQMLAWSAGYDKLHEAMLSASAAYKATTGEAIPEPPPSLAGVWRDEAIR